MTHPSIPERHAEVEIERKAHELAKSIRLIRRRKRKRERDYADANVQLVELIEAAREAGATWYQIADAMEMTRGGVEFFIKNTRERSG